MYFFNRSMPFSTHVLKRGQLKLQQNIASERTLSALVWSYHGFFKEILGLIIWRLYKAKFWCGNTFYPLWRDIKDCTTDKWLCNISSATLFKCQRFITTFSSPMYCFPLLPPAFPSSPTSHPLPSSSKSQRSFPVVGLVFSKSPTTIWWSEPVWRSWQGHTASCRQRARLPFSAAFMQDICKIDR